MKNSIETYRFRQGTVPLLISMPHVGTYLPPSLANDMTDEAKKLPDTDWHLERLYDFLDELGVSVLIATHSRYVIDLSRPTDGASLYPGQDTTSLCPVDTFHKEAIYAAGRLPDLQEIERRSDTYWRPYHARIEEELQRIRELHGYALLWDAHSICSELPRFFQGKLPDFNFGTASGASCDEGLEERLRAVAQRAKRYSNAFNGRFKGGFITRQYGRPLENIHAVQLELSEATYMNETFPYDFNESLAAEVRPLLRQFMCEMLEWGRNHNQR